MQQHRGKNRLL